MAVTTEYEISRRYTGLRRIGLAHGAYPSPYNGLDRAGLLAKKALGKKYQASRLADGSGFRFILLFVREV